MDRALALAAAGAAFVLYALTLQPDFGGPEDTPKFQFLGHVLGIPHPPGYPLYVLLSYAFVSVVRIGTIAYRANLFSAVMAAFACGLAYGIARQAGARRWASCCAALGLATGASFWRSAVFAEVYSLAAVMVALTVGLLLAWGARGGTARLVAAFGAFAFGLGNHLTIIGVVPAFAVYVLTRGRPVWSLRVVGVSAVLLGLGLTQYGLIVVRTRQNAPYVEVRADTVKDLMGVVTAERFADQRFAFGPSVLLTDHLPALASVIARELGIIGTLFFLAGGWLAWRRAGTAFVLGAAVGTFVMVLNISGDLKGFITPLMVLLWPVAAVGIDELANRARFVPHGARVAIGVLAIAALAPVANLAGNYAANDQSGEGRQAAFLRGLFSHLPDRAGFVAEDYWSDMAWRYYALTGEAGPLRQMTRVDFDADSVRRAATELRRVFAFANAATYFSAEGLMFTRVSIARPTLDGWLASLPVGTLVVGAVAYAPFPASLSALGHADARPPGRDHSFEAFAIVIGRPGSAWRVGDAEATLQVDGRSLGGAMPPVPGSVEASTGPRGAAVTIAGRPYARVENGVAVVAVEPNGTLAGVLELAPGETHGAEPAGAVYELTRESACATLTSAWTDVAPVFSSGSWVATMYETGSVTVETVVTGSRDVHARSAMLLGDGSIRTTVNADPAGDILTTELTRTGERRAIFRLALDRSPPAARARLRTDGALQSLRVCELAPARPLFEPGGTRAVLRPDFESEAYFGAGWGDVMRAPTGPVRRGEDGASLLLPLEANRGYTISLDLQAEEAGSLEAHLDGEPVGTCNAQGPGLCELALVARVAHSGACALTLTWVRERPSPRSFLFRGAWLRSYAQLVR